MSPSRRAPRVVRTVIAVAVAAAIWLLTAGSPTGVRFWSVTLVVFLPLLAVRQADLIGDPGELPRIPAYLSSIVSLWLIAFLTAAVARFGAIGPADLRLVPIGWLPFLLWSLAPIAAALAVLLIASRLGIRESPLLIRLLPVTRQEKQVFAGLSITAGFCEELVFRGFLIHVLDGPIGTAGAVLASSLAFGLAHAYQDAAGSARATLLGVVLSLPPVLSGSLWPSVLAHTVIDLLGGICLRHRIVRDVA